MFQPEDEQFNGELSKIYLWDKAELLSPEEKLQLTMASAYDLFHRQKGLANLELFKSAIQRCEKHLLLVI